MAGIVSKARFYYFGYFCASHRSCCATMSNVGRQSGLGSQHAESNIWNSFGHCETPTTGRQTSRQAGGKDGQDRKRHRLNATD